jgi:hypothetical protein
MSVQVEPSFKREPIWSQMHKDWIMHEVGCLISGRVPCDPHHVPTRGAGGDDRNIVGLAHEYHAEWHNMGEGHMVNKYGRNFREIALILARRSPDKRIREAVSDK